MGNKPNRVLSTLLWNDSAVSPRNKMLCRFFMILSDWISLSNWILKLGKICWLYYPFGVIESLRGEGPDLPSRVIAGQQGPGQRSPDPNPYCCQAASSVLSFMDVLPQLSPNSLPSSFGEVRGQGQLNKQFIAGARKLPLESWHRPIKSNTQLD